MGEHKVGKVSAVVAIISMAEVHIYLGMIATLMTIILLTPQTIMKWRELRKDYLKLTRETRKHGFWYFMLYCFGGLRALKKETETPFYNTLD